MEPLRILLVDDHTLIRRGLAALLAGEEGFRVVGEAADGLAAIDVARQTRPDIIIMEIRLPGGNGLELAKKVKRLYPQIRLVINTDSDSPEYNNKASHIGADYFRSKKLNTTNDLVSVVVALYSAAKGDKQNYISERT